jgi:hypothetical protein
MNPYIQSWDIESSTSDAVYKVSQRMDGSLACNCPRWKFQKSPKLDCKHCEAVRSLENLRTGLAVARDNFERLPAYRPLPMASRPSNRPNNAPRVNLERSRPMKTSEPVKVQGILEQFTIRRKIRDE